MASRYWVGGAGTWDTSSTAHWSATNGGAPGASAPTSADDVFFTSLSGSGLVTCSGILGNFLSITCTGYTGSMDGTIGNASGVIVLSSGGTFSQLLIGVTNDLSLTCAGKSVAFFDIFSGTTTCVDAFGGGQLIIESGATLLLKNGVTSTCSSLGLPTTGANAALRSVLAGSQATLSDSSGVNELRYATVKDIAFTGGAEWVASTNFTDNGNNTGFVRRQPLLFTNELF